MQSSQQKISPFLQTLRNSINFGAYSDPQVSSLGGHIGPYGASVGLDQGIPFMNANYNGTPTADVGPYQDPQLGISSYGGRVGPFGATLGLDNGTPFGSYNYKGKVLGQFGPQGY